MVFGGLIQHIGRLEVLGRYKIRVHDLPAGLVRDAKVGDSIAINGVCLTVVSAVLDPPDAATGYFDFELSDETLAKTTLSAPPQLAVHVEPALRFGDPIGGHLVSGHVHGVGTLTKLDVSTGEMIVKLPVSTFPAAPVLKDSITIDGVSLTIAEVLPETESIRIALVPHTIKITQFRNLAPGAAVNVEMNIERLRASVAQGAVSPPWAPGAAQYAAGGTTTARGPEIVAAEDAVSGGADVYWMRRAIAEAEKGRLTAPPNPWVGSVLVDAKNNFVQGGYHKRPGEPHAEREITADMAGCTLYVTLEPCCHYGRTPPCVDHLLVKRPARVVVGTLDPDPRVSGKGVAQLREAGIPVAVGVAEEEVKFSLRSYLWHRSHDDTPYVVAKLALSQDNCYAYTTDTDVQRQWITGEYARHHGHGIRAASQRIVVGKNTANMDKPQLTVRYGYVVDRQPEAVVSTRALDWYHTGDKNCLQILVEGGPELQDDLLRRGVIQEFVLYRSSKILGLHGLRWMPSFSSVDWVLAETQTFVDGDTMQRFVRRAVLSPRSTPPPASEPAVKFDTLEVALEALRQGSMIIVMDDESRENEGDLMLLADRISLRNMKILLANTTGIVCATMTASRARQLNLPLMVPHQLNRDRHRTKFTVSVDGAVGVTTGVSAADRMRTLSLLAAATTKPEDLARPGHIFPLIAAAGGLHERRGHTEAGVELARMAGMTDPVMVICELYDNSTGKMMRRPQCAQLGFPIITIDTIRDAVLGPVWSDLLAPECTSRWEVMTWGGVGDDRVIRCLRNPDRKPTAAPEGELAQPNAKPGPKRTLAVAPAYTTADYAEPQQAVATNKALQQLMLQLESQELATDPNHAGCYVVLQPRVSKADGEPSIKAPSDFVDAFHPYAFQNPDETPTVDSRFAETVVRTLKALGVAPETVSVKVVDGSAAPTEKGKVPHSGGTQQADSEGPRRVTQKGEVAPGIEMKKVSPKPWNLTSDDKLTLARAHVCIVQAEWHRQFSDPLALVIEEELNRHFGVTRVSREFAPGSFELPRIIQHLASVDRTITVFIAIGILVKGETDHYDLVARETTSGVARLQLSDKLWIVNAVLACHDVQQVAERCLPDSEKCVGPHMAHAAARLAICAGREAAK